jgi:ketosteroid isomerase-like protein
MSPAQQHEDVARKMFESLASGDTTPVAPYLQEQSLVKFRGANPLAGDHRGPAAIASVLQRMLALTAERQGKLELFQVIANEDHAMTRFRLQASSGSRALQTIGCQVTRLSGGKISEVWYSFDDPYGFDACYG